MTGTTGLHNLRVDCIVGIHPHERENEQTVFIDLEVDYDFAPAAASDAIGDAVDYDLVTSLVTNIIKLRRFQLLEAMAEAVVVALFQELPKVKAVRLEIRKPDAVPAAANSFVRVERHRQ